MSTAASTKIRDVMTPHPVVLPSTASVSDAARAMRDSNIGAVVVGNGKELFGIVTDRDLVVRAIAGGRDPSRVQLAEVCSREVSGLTPDDSLDRAMQMMRSKAVRRLPVIDGSEAVGIVSLGDVAQLLDRPSVLGTISSARPNH